MLHYVADILICSTTWELFIHNNIQALIIEIRRDINSQRKKAQTFSQKVKYLGYIPAPDVTAVQLLGESCVIWRLMALDNKIVPSWEGPTFARSGSTILDK